MNRILGLVLLFLIGVCCVQNVSSQNAEDNRGDDITLVALNSGFVFNDKLVPKISDGAYERQRYENRKALSLPPIREADVKMAKRLWRLVDTKDLMNAPFSCEFNPLVEILMEIGRGDSIHFYSNDRFTDTIPKVEILDQSSVVEVFDYDSLTFRSVKVENELDVQSFDKFKIKEDWIYDARHSRMISRIIGIAPVKKVYDPGTGLFRGYQVLFWMHYPSIRDELAKYIAYHPNNSDFKYSWQQILDARWFYSTVIKDQEHKSEWIHLSDKEKVKEMSDKALNKLSEFEYNLWLNDSNN